MTLNFDILAGSNASWGVDFLAAAPERSPAPAIFTPLSVTAGTETDSLPLSPPLMPVQHALSSTLPAISQSPFFSDSEENVSPLRNESLNPTLQASDPAVRAYDSNLYVASLPEWFGDADLHDLFKRFGPIVSAKVMCHKGTHHCKGYGFVLFQRSDDAAMARSEMIGHVVGGSKIQVRRARSAASAPLTEAVPAITTAFGDSVRSTRTSSANVTPINYAAHLVPTPQSPFHSFFPAAPGSAPAFVLTSGSGAAPGAAHPQSAMFVAFPNGAAGMPSSTDVMYMLLSAPGQQMQASSAIY